MSWDLSTKATLLGWSGTSGLGPDLNPDPNWLWDLVI